MVRANQQHDLVTVAIRADGRRVPVRLSDVSGSPSLIDIVRDLLLGLIALIAGSRREPGGSR
ncbi:MAG TPA: hypothetical protein VFW92_10985 [Candidatus Limnocylindrales bacterium]|nr:hypothetical protein [Candidatus Limnocylindrales bacterium]